MQVVHDAQNSVDLPYGAVVTIGNYDGLHAGQQKVIEAAVRAARKRRVQSAVITFDPHPKSVLQHEDEPVRLLLPEQRERRLAELGVDMLLMVQFTRDLAQTAPERFVREFLGEAMAVEEVFVGSDFAFGKGREGNVELLERLGSELGFEVHGIEEATYQGEVISATRIRRAIREGKVDLAMEMLGRPYALVGKVVRGDRMGMRLGWPTINLHPENEQLPADGVYCGRARFLEMPGIFDCVTNIGTRPTVYENYQRVVESHLLGYSADAYGRRVEVLFYKRLREEKLFSSVMDLSAQIGRDVESAKEYFANRRRLGLDPVTG